MQIGIISDTHGLLFSSALEQFKNVQHIFHAGDIGRLEIIKELEKIAPVSAVSGNMDNWNIKRILPPISFTDLENMSICLVHDIGNMKNFCFELFKKKQKADIIFHGHTHRPSYEIFQNKIFINPGSSTHPRTLNSGTIAIVQLCKKELKYKFVELDINKVKKPFY